jgi:hypothetical protein
MPRTDYTRCATGSAWCRQSQVHLRPRITRFTAASQGAGESFPIPAAMI